MEVIDGQHRLEICKKNGLPIFYMVDNEFQKNDIMSVQSSKKWRQGDYLHYYSKNKINPYVIMDNIISKYPICITTFIRMFCTKTDKHMTRQFVSGKISLKYKEKEIEEIMRQFEEVKKICHYLFGYRKYSRDFETAMISVLMTIKNSENGSFEHFKERLQHSAAQIEKATYLNSLVLIKKVFIDEIYNFNMKKNKLSIC